MRTIKFRAWDKDGQIMYEPFELSDLFGANISYIQFIERDERGGKKISENFEIMQYTGLKDKNGKEIYEGDICEIYTYISEEGEKIDREIHEVQWFGEEGYPAFDLKDWDGDSNGLSYITQSNENWEIEVIGNVFKNKELLNN